MNNVHPLFRGILTSHFYPAEPTEADKARALELALDVKNEMPDWLRLEIFGKYGTAEHIAKFAESLDAVTN